MKKIVSSLLAHRFPVAGRFRENMFLKRNYSGLAGGIVNWLVILTVITIFTQVSMSFAGTSSTSRYGKMVMRIQKVSTTRVLVVPGNKSAFVQLRGQGLDKITSVRVSKKQGEKLAAVRGATARVTMIQPNMVTIGITAAKGTMLGDALLELGLKGASGTVTLPTSMLGIGIVPSSKKPDLAGSAGITSSTGGVGSGPAETKSSLGSVSWQTGKGSMTQPQSSSKAGGSTNPLDARISTGARDGAGGSDSVGGGMYSGPSKPGGQATSQQTTPSGMASGRHQPISSQKTGPSSTVAGTWWSGSSSTTDTQSSSGGGSQSVSSAEYYTNEQGTRTTVTTTHENGHTYQAVSSTDTKGNTTESQSIDGVEVAGTESPKGDTGTEDTGSPGSTVSTSIDMGTGKSYQVPGKTMPTSQPNKGNVDPKPDSMGASGPPKTASEEIKKIDMKKGLGGDGLQPTSNIQKSPKTMTTVKPNKGDIDPAPGK